MPRRVGHDEHTAVGGEESVRDVDRDALLALGLEAVDEQGQIELITRGAELPGILHKREELILRNQPRVIQQPSDERRLAVIDRAAGENPQQVLLVRGGGGHQKYPSRFLRSIDAA